MPDSVDMIAAFGGESELVTYTPYGQAPRTFRALIDRQPSQIGGLAGIDFPENSLTVLFPRDATAGVLTVTKGKDRIRFKRNRGDRQETEFTVAMMQAEDAGMVSSDGGMFTILVK